MDDLEKEFKKLNYGLGSYPCGYVAGYQLNKIENSVAFKLEDASDEALVMHKFALPVTTEDMNAFKMECIKLCSHAKKKGS
jgi:hypothetical protein